MSEQADKRAWEVFDAAEPFVGRWGRWIKARANHARSMTGGRPNEHDYLTVQKHIDRLATALFEFAEQTDRREAGAPIPGKPIREVLDDIHTAGGSAWDEADEQADKPFDAQKEYDEAEPMPISDERIEEIVKKVTASPSAYQRKLAEAIFDDDMDSLAEVAPEVAKMFRTSMRDKKIDRIAAVLASERVVDPTHFEKLLGDLEKMKEAWDALPRSEAVDQLIQSRAKVERLTAELDRERIDTGRNAYAAGREQAAKKCDEIDEPDVASAIRADKERGDE